MFRDVRVISSSRFHARKERLEKIGSNRLELTSRLFVEKRYRGIGDVFNRWRGSLTPSILERGRGERGKKRVQEAIGNWRQRMAVRTHGEP